MPAYDGRRFDPPAPLARVILQHPDREASIADVPMLIDSGSDLTLLPAAAVRSLGIVGTGETFRLEAFDGTSSESEVIRVDLVFERKVFRGRYVAVEAEVGVLGRDILNHLRLLLDGPALNWSVG